MNSVIERAIPAPVQWAEGMLLAPQHFQQNQIYYERLLCHQMAQCRPHYWGVYHLEIDQSRLLTGTVVIKELHAVMPDGLVVQYDSSQRQSNQLPLMYEVNREGPLADGDSLTLYLTVPIRAEGAASSNASIRRFTSWEQSQISDENTGDNHLEVYRLSPILELKSGDKIADKYDRIPLLRIKKESMYKVEPFFPPLLAVTTKPFLEMHSLGTLIQKSLVNIRKKATQLAQFCQMENGAAGAAVGQAHRQTIFQLTCMLPQLEVLLQSQRAHPFELYQGLAQLVGHMAPLSPTLVPYELPAYDHNNCIDGFLRALTFIKQTLATIQLAYSTVQFDKDTNNIFSIQIDAAWQQEKLVLGLKARDGVSEQQLADWIKHCHIASAPIQQRLRKARVAGCRTRTTSRDDEIGIVASNGCILVEVERDDTLILPGQPLQIICSTPAVASYTPAAILLYVPHHENQLAASAKTQRSKKPGKSGA